MKVLIACEYSGVVRDAFLARGHDAMSCDLLPTESPGPHYQGDVSDVLYQGWDLMIAHPPCTYLTVSANGAFKGENGWTKVGTKRGPWRREEVTAALDFVRLLMAAPIHRIAIENPIGVISTRIRKPDQIIQPWQFGHGETKATCLWLKNLPALWATCLVEGREQRMWKMGPSPERSKDRSLTYAGIAAAFADQWGGTIERVQEAAA